MRKLFTDVYYSIRIQSENRNTIAIKITSGRDFGNIMSHHSILLVGSLKTTDLKIIVCIVQTVVGARMIKCQYHGDNGTASDSLLLSKAARK